MRIPLSLLAVFFLTLQTSQAGLRWEPLGEPGSGGWLTSLRVNPRDSAHLVLGGDMLGLGLSRDGGRRWGGGFGLPSWEIGDVTFHPTEPATVWAATMSGPAVSRDGGETWEPKRQGFPAFAEGMYSAPVQRILFDPADARRLLAFAGSYRGWNSPGAPKVGYVWESLDGGESWHDFSAVSAFRNITWADADLAWKRLYAVVEKRGVFLSEDRGKTWQRSGNGLPEGAAIRMVAVHPQDADRAWVGVGNYPAGKDAANFLPGGIYRTTDGGKTWSRSGRGLPENANANPNFATRFQAVALSPANPLHMATSDTAWNNEAVYHSGDGGETWNRVLDKADYPSVPVAYPAGMGASVITFDPQETGTFYVANSESVLATRDSGATWSDRTSSPVRRENPVSWTGHGYSGLCSTRVVFNPFRAGSVVLTAMDAGKHLRSDDDLQSWFFYQKGFAQPWGGANDAAFAGPEGQIVYLATGQHGNGGAIARSDDGGRTWLEFEGESRGLPAQAEATAVHCDPQNPDLAWAIMGGELHSTADGGKSWTLLPDMPGSTAIGSPPGRVFPFYVGYRDGVMKTTDGRTFTPLKGAPPSPARVVVPARSPEEVYVVRHRTDDGGVHQWKDNSWKQIFRNSHASDVAVHPTDPARMAVATSDDPYHDESRATGVWVTTDAGASWTQANEGLSCLRGKTIAFDPFQPDRLIFGTFGRGFFQTHWPGPAGTSTEGSGK